MSKGAIPQYRNVTNTKVLASKFTPVINIKVMLKGYTESPISQSYYWTVLAITTAGKWGVINVTDKSIKCKFIIIIIIMYQQLYVLY